jgi:hypothetical protein
MTCIRTIRLDISLDEDFFPVLEKSVVEFAASMNIPESALLRVGEMVRRFLDGDLSDVLQGSVELEFGASDGRFFLLARDPDRRILFDGDVELS